MAEVIKILGQLDPAAGVLTDLYTAPSGKAAVISRIIVANRDVETRYRLAAARGGAPISDEQYLAFDTPISGSRAIKPSIGLTLQPTDKLRVMATLGTLSFGAFGVERDISATPEDFRILAQSNPAAAILTDAYIVAANSFAVLSRIVVANRSATPTLCRVAIAPNGAAAVNAHYIAYDEPVGGNDSVIIPGCTGITLDGDDVVRIYATLPTLSFGIFGYGPASGAAAAPWANFWWPPYFTQAAA